MLALPLCHSFSTTVAAIGSQVLRAASRYKMASASSEREIVIIGAAAPLFIMFLPRMRPEALTEFQEVG